MREALKKRINAVNDAWTEELDPPAALRKYLAERNALTMEAIDSISDEAVAAMYAQDAPVVRKEEIMVTNPGLVERMEKFYDEHMDEYSAVCLLVTLRSIFPSANITCKKVDEQKGVLH